MEILYNRMCLKLKAITHYMEISFWHPGEYLQFVTKPGLCHFPDLPNLSILITKDNRKRAVFISLTTNIYWSPAVHLVLFYKLGVQLGDASYFPMGDRQETSTKTISTLGKCCELSKTDQWPGCSGQRSAVCKGNVELRLSDRESASEELREGPFSRGNSTCRSPEAGTAWPVWGTEGWPGVLESHEGRASAESERPWLTILPLPVVAVYHRARTIVVSGS